MGDIAWQAGKAYREIIYETIDGIAKITINRPERRNAFTPLTVNELYDAFIRRSAVGDRRSISRAFF